MAPDFGLSQAWHWTVRKTLSLWVKVTIKPADAASLIAARPRPVCYVLERESQTDLAALNEVCGRLRLPRPIRRLLVGGRRADRAFFNLERRANFWSTRTDARTPRYLTQLVAAAATDPTFDLDLVPVAIFWGRAPSKEASWWRLLFAEDWMLVGRFRKLLAVMVNGRNTVVNFGEPLRLRDALGDEISEARSARRILRSLRATLRGQRASTIGPDLSHRRTIVAQVLKTLAVRRAVRSEMRIKGVSRRVTLQAARKCALEIAANYSHPFVSFMSSILGWLWNRLYDGVEFENVGKLQEAGGAEIVYVPCHRSHMDYLLLSYAIYRKGYAVPHVAAGVNLNLPLVGRLLRMGGGFFMRRSFKGEALYSAVFTQYLAVMMGRGHPLEYFIEGGRSRTGRLLAPKTGMLSMTVRSYLRYLKRPVVFMPVYFGYERIVEGSTYIGELSGQPKKKESIFGLLRAAKVLRSKFGKVHVNFGEPIALDGLLDRHCPEWRASLPQDPELSAPWIGAAVSELAMRINAGINSAAAVTPINLVAMAVLATPRQAMAEADLIRLLDRYRALLREAPYGPLVTLTPMNGAQMAGYAQAMGMLVRHSHPLGDIMQMRVESAVLATYYRNNILHLFAMPSLLACGFVSNAVISTIDIQRLVWRVYPYIAAELYLRWDESQVSTVVESLLEAFVRLELLQGSLAAGEWQRPAPASTQAVQLSMLAAATIQTIERYYLVVALLLQVGSGAIGQEQLEQRCHLMAQRMSLLYGLNSPEFFDKSLFRNFIDLLRRRQVIQIAADQKIVFGAPLAAVAQDAQLVLSAQIRHSILQVTLGQ
jgi:glycerol-3-phosphate O-acyltransferase